MTLKMTSAQVVDTSVTNNSSFQNYTHPDDHAIRTTDTPGLNMTLKMTSAQVVDTSVTNNSSFQNYTHPDDHAIRTTDTPGFKPFTKWYAFYLCALHWAKFKLFNLQKSMQDIDVKILK